MYRGGNPLYNMSWKVSFNTQHKSKKIYTYIYSPSATYIFRWYSTVLPGRDIFPSYNLFLEQNITCWTRILFSSHLLYQNPLRLIPAVPESSPPHIFCTRILSASHLLYQNPPRLTPAVPESSLPHTCCTRILSSSHLLYQNPLLLASAVPESSSPHICCTIIISSLYMLYQNPLLLTSAYHNHLLIYAVPESTSSHTCSPPHQAQEQMHWHCSTKCDLLLTWRT